MAKKSKKVKIPKGDVPYTGSAKVGKINIAGKMLDVEGSIKYMVFIMDRNTSYEKWQYEQMKINTQLREIEGKHNKPHKLKKSRSKEQLHILSISEIIYDNRQKIPDNDYIIIMNHLKDLCKHPKC